MKKIRIMMFLYALIHSYNFLSQNIITRCEDCIIECRLNNISDLSSKEKYKNDKIKRFGINIYGSYPIENVSLERISMRNFFKKINDSIVLIERMNERIQYETQIKSNWKFKNVANAYCSIVENLVIPDEEIIQIYIFEMRNKSAANDLFKVVQTGIIGRKNAYVLQNRKFVVIIFTTFYHTMAIKYLKCLDKEILFDKVNYGYSPPIKRKRK